MKKVLFGLSIACTLCMALVFDGCNGVDPFDPTSYCYKLTYTPTKGSDRGKYIVDYVWMNGDDLLSHKQWIETTYGVYPSHEKITGTSSKSECLAHKNGSSSQGGGGSSSGDEQHINKGTWYSGNMYLEFYDNGTFTFWVETGYEASSFTAHGTYSKFGDTYTLYFTDCDNPNFSQYASGVKQARITTDGTKLEFLDRYFEQAK